MSVPDVQGEAIVIRIVYDGPPFSGKTTTLKALSADLARPLETPLEAEGRTLFFDWLDYTGGRFEGRPIRCQIVSVPGQRAFRERRRRLLAQADAVVFVADTGRVGLDLSLQYARELRELLARAGAPEPGVVVQANKRDVEDALGMPEVIAAFRKVGLEVGFVESTATTTAGVKQAFVFAVRLALDRVRDLARGGGLAMSRPEIDTAEELLEQLEPGALAGARARATAAAGALAPASTERLPDPDAPSGLIWPPIQGRIMLQQARAGLPQSAGSEMEGGIGAVSHTGWRVHSRTADVFDSIEIGRHTLIEWARLHARNSQWISPRRSLVLAPRSRGEWRLWQIVADERSLEHALNPGSAQSSVTECVDRLIGVSRQLVEASAVLRKASLSLPATLRTVSADSGRYIGLMPATREAVDRPADVDVDTDALLARHMGEPIRTLLGRHPAAMLVAGLRAAAERSPAHTRALADRLRQLCAAVA